MPSLKLIIEDSVEAARLNMDSDFSMTNSVRQSVNGLPNQNFNFNSNANDSVFFEEVKQTTPASKGFATQRT